MATKKAKKQPPSMADFAQLMLQFITPEQLAAAMQGATPTPETKPQPKATKPKKPTTKKTTPKAARPIFASKKVVAPITTVAPAATATKKSAAKPKTEQKPVKTNGAAKESAQDTPIRQKRLRKVWPTNVVAGQNKKELNGLKKKIELLKGSNSKGAHLVRRFRPGQVLGGDWSIYLFSGRFIAEISHLAEAYILPRAKYERIITEKLSYDKAVSLTESGEGGVKLEPKYERAWHKFIFRANRDLHAMAPYGTQQWSLAHSKDVLRYGENTPPPGYGFPDLVDTKGILPITALHAKTRKQYMRSTAKPAKVTPPTAKPTKSQATTISANGMLSKIMELAGAKEKSGQIEVKSAIVQPKKKAANTKKESAKPTPKAAPVTKLPVTQKSGDLTSLRSKVLQTLNIKTISEIKKENEAATKSLNSKKPTAKGEPKKAPALSITKKKQPEKPPMSVLDLSAKMGAAEATIEAINALMSDVVGEGKAPLPTTQSVGAYDFPKDAVSKLNPAKLQVLTGIEFALLSPMAPALEDEISETENRAKSKAIMGSGLLWLSGGVGWTENIPTNQKQIGIPLLTASSARKILKQLSPFAFVTEHSPADFFEKNQRKLLTSTAATAFANLIEEDEDSPKTRLYWYAVARLLMAKITTVQSLVEQMLEYYVKHHNKAK